MDQQIARQLQFVVRRLVRLRRWWTLSWTWSLIALLAAGANMLLPSGSYAVAVVNGLLVVGVGFTLQALLPKRSTQRLRLQAARLIEQKWPSLQQRLLTVIEQQPDISRAGFSFLQQELVAEVRSHSYVHDWRQAVPQRRIVGRIATTFLAVFLSLYLTGHIRDSAAPMIAETEDKKIEATAASLAEKFNVTIEPGHAEVERGSALLITATFDGRLPSNVTLKQTVAEAGSNNETGTGNRTGAGTGTGTGTGAGTGKGAGLQMSRSMRQSLKDPLFGTRLATVNRPFEYTIQFDDQTSEVFNVSVYELPRVEQVDAKIEFPSWSGMTDEVIEDTWRVSTVEGSSAVLTVRLNKKIAQGRLVDREGDEFPLVPSGETAGASGESDFRYETRIPVDRTRRLQFRLEDDRGRKNRGEEEFILTATPNRPPEIKLTFPGRDLRVSPIEELELEATVWDDFGVAEHGLVLSVAEQEPKTVTLGKKASGRKKHELAHRLALERESAEPDQLVSYYFFADDIGPGGEKRRTMSDLFFAEVRHFEEIFREGQAPPGGGAPAGQSAQKASELAELQKQIINATWKVIRRETADRATADEVSDAFSDDVELVIASQQTAIEQLTALAQKLRDPQSKRFAAEVDAHMKQAVERLTRASQEQSADLLNPALEAERAASQGLLKLRAREHSVVRQQSSQGSGSGSKSASQQQLDQLELDNKKNRYEAEKKAGRQKQEQQNREQLQVLNRLRELARRQGDLNEKLRELELELKAAESEEEREEIERQLKRLREEQRELLRNVDELKERMQRPENQRQMAESRKKLDDTRSKVRRASEALEKGRLSQALNSGTRAERELEQLRDEVRQKAAGQFGEEMRDLRREAREIGERQDAIAQTLNQKKEAQGRRRSLRSETKESTDVRTELDDQKKQLDQVMDRMKDVVKKSETAEPLLARQLYETVRKARADRLKDALDETEALTRRGLMKDAATVERVAHQGVDHLQKGIETAADAVLGNELEALKRARNELEEAGEAVKRELARADPDQLQKRRRSQRPRPDGDRSPTKQQARTQQARTQQSGEGKPRSDSRSGEQPKPSDTSKPGNSESDRKESGNKSQSRSASPSQQGRGASGNTGASGQSESGQSESSQSESGQSESGQSGDQPEGQPSPDSSSGSSTSGAQPRSPQSPRQPPGLRPARNGDNQPTPQNSGSSRSRSGGGGSSGGTSTGTEAPLTGPGFVEWSDRLRNIEELVDDPELRAEVARVRESARSMRAEFKRHSKEPEWSLVRMQILEPLSEIEDRLREEIARRESPDALVPIDRDPVPKKYADLVRRYYERIGSGK